MIAFSVSHASGARTRIERASLRTLVGSNPFCDVLLEDPQAAPTQLVVHRAVEDGSLAVEAKGPGTRLNGRALAAGERAPLATGDCLTCGGSAITLDFDAAALARPDGVSAYVVAFSVGEFGNMAWSETHVVASRADVHRVFAALAAAKPDRRQFAFWPDAVLGVWVIQRGHPLPFIDAADCFSTELEGRRSTLPALRDAGEDPIDRFEAGEDLPLTLDWAALDARLPELAPPVMGPPDTLTVVDPVDDDGLRLCEGCRLASFTAD